tara:strand:+ start:278 stop:571 length:294 start_codon:yes stop_codon:yes gene_type:complete
VVGHIKGENKMIICYKKGKVSTGQASDLQWRKSPEADDIVYEGNQDSLPDIETLHDASYIAQKEAEVQAEADRKASVKAKLKALGLTTDEVKTTFGI